MKVITYFNNNTFNIDIWPKYSLYFYFLALYKRKKKRIYFKGKFSFFYFNIDSTNS